MSSAATNIILLAPEADIRREVTEALPGAAAYDSPLEALADFAEGIATTLIATTAGLGSKFGQLPRPARSKTWTTSLFS